MNLVERLLQLSGIYIYRLIDLMGFRSYINEFGREAFAIEWDLVAIWPLNWFFLGVFKQLIIGFLGVNLEF